MKWLSFVAVLFSLYAGAATAQSIPSGANNSSLRTYRARPSKLFAPRTLSIQGLQNANPSPIFPNIDVTNDPNDDQNEPSISVNPLDPLVIAIGEIDDRSFNVLWDYTTTDGGQSWLSGALPAGFYESGTLQYEEATDPGVVFDQDGILFFSNVFLANSGPNEEACYKSSDDGLSWQSPVYAGGDTITGFTSTADRDYITVDRDETSPYFGRVYITWVSIADSNSIIVESHSTDHGASWSIPVGASPAPSKHDSVLFQGPIPACGPKGELYITYTDRDSLSKSILVSRSTDGGSSFAPQVLVSQYIELGPVIPDNFNGHPAIKGNVETNSFPSIAVDRSTIHSGRIYVTWCGRSLDSSAHVFLSTSDDNGQTWATPRFIDNDSSAVKTDKFFPWIAVDQSSGDVGVTFYDSRNDPDSNILIDDYLTLSTDGGETFTARRISNVSSDPRVCRDVNTVDNVSVLFFGDYISLDAMDSVWYPTWTDTRSGNDQDICLSVVQPYAPMPVTNLSSHDTTISGKIANVLTWDFSHETTFGYSVPPDCQFVILKDTSLLAIQPGTQLSFVDTNDEVGRFYKVTVRANGYQSATDSITVLHDAVEAAGSSISSIKFLNDPAIVDHQDEMQIDCNDDCRVSVNFYDELGREVGPTVADGNTSSHHELLFTPNLPGVRFFVVKRLTANSSIEVSGKISVLRN